MCPGGGLADLQLAGGAGFHDQAVPPGHCGQVATRDRGGPCKGYLSGLPSEAALQATQAAQD